MEVDFTKTSLAKDPAAAYDVALLGRIRANGAAAVPTSAGMLRAIETAMAQVTASGREPAAAEVVDAGLRTVDGLPTRAYASLVLISPGDAFSGAVNAGDSQFALMPASSAGDYLPACISHIEDDCMTCLTIVHFDLDLRGFSVSEFIRRYRSVARAEEVRILFIADLEEVIESSLL